MFAQEIDNCDRILSGQLDIPLKTLLLDEVSQLNQTEYTQPALVALEYAMGTLWQQWGVTADIYVGHSVGEITAACMAGVFTIEDALTLAVHRGRLMQSLPANGGMVSLTASEQQTESLLEKLHPRLSGLVLSVSAVNTSRQTIVSGHHDALSILSDYCETQEIDVFPLNVSHAFHSALMKPMLTPFADILGELEFRPAQKPVISNFTGTMLPVNGWDSGYWLEHITNAVRFRDSILHLNKEYGEQPLTFLECGPHPVLSQMVQQIDSEDPGKKQSTWDVHHTQKRNNPPDYLQTLIELHLQRYKIDWRAFYSHRKGRRIKLPGYAFGMYPLRSPALGELLRPEHSSGTPSYSLELSPSTFPALFDHLVFDIPTVPGAFYIALLVALCRKKDTIAPVVIEQIAFPNPLILAKESQLVVTITGENNGDERVIFHRGGKDDSTVYAEALLKAHSPDLAGSTVYSLPELEQRHPESVDLDLIMDQWLAEGSVTWHNLWRKLTRVLSGNGSTLITVSDSPNHADLLSPAVIDNVFVGILSGLGQSRCLDPVLPFSIERLTLTPALFHKPEQESTAPRVYGYIRSSEAAQEGGDDFLKVDIDYLDGDGRPLMTMTEMLFRRVRKQAWHSEDDQGAPELTDSDNWFYIPKADPCPLPEITNETEPVSRVLIDGISLPAQVAHSVTSDIKWDKINSLEQWLRSAGKAHEDDEPPQGVSQYVLLYDGSYRQQESWSVQLGDYVAAIAQVLARIARRQVSAQIILVGLGKDEAVILLHTSLSPLLSTVALEHPDIVCRAVQLEAYSGARLQGELNALLSQETSEVQHIRWENGQRHILMLARLGSEVAPSVGGEPEAESLVGMTCVVTGGSGSLGLVLARWLVEQKVSQLHLVSRHSPSPAMGSEIEKLCQTGVSVTCHQVDVADQQAMEKILSPFREVEGLSLFHLAGIVDDAILLNSDPAKCNEVLQPKVQGAWNLHTLTRDFTNLRHFVLFSSAASLFGSPGQSCYAVANGFLDALAQYRATQKLPALAIDWGPVRDSHMDRSLAENDKRRIRSRGLRALPIEEVPRQLARLMPLSSSPYSRIGVLDIDRSGLERDIQPTNGPTASELSNQSTVEIGELVRTRICEVLKLPRTMLFDDTVPLRKLGMDSLMALEIRNLLVRDTEDSLPASLLFDFPTAEQLIVHLEQRKAKRKQAAMGSSTMISPKNGAEHGISQPCRQEAAPQPLIESAEAVVISAMACRFPGGVESPEDLWDLLEKKVNVAREVPPERWNVDDFFHPSPGIPGTMSTRYSGFLDNIDLFDAAFFETSEPEAVAMDPQQRILLETIWSACERAGLTEQKLSGSRTGVFVGMMGNEYAAIAGRNIQNMDGFVGTGNSASIASGRIAYTLGLTGPAVTIDTACSSFLVALHLACNSLEKGECNQALVGATGLTLTPAMHIEFSQLGGLAPDGRCKPFSASADGVGWSEGCAAVVLRREDLFACETLPRLAIIRGSAVNQDGRSQGLTAPRGEAQQQVICQALEDAGWGVDDIDYIEAHGTGTSLGDPMEVHAMGEVFRGRRRTTKVIFGSVKGNLGHTQAASGGASMIKVLLSMQHRRIPASLFADTPDTEIPWAQLPLSLASRETHWPSREEGPLRAGISAFGISGTNAHIVIESPPERENVTPAPAHTGATWPFVVSARSEEALRQQAEQLLVFVKSHLADNSPCLGQNLKSLSRTLACHRTLFSHHVEFSAASAEELKRSLYQIQLGQTVPAKDTPLSFDPEHLFRDDDGHVLPIPTYPFQRRSFWAESKADAKPDPMMFYSEQWQHRSLEQLADGAISPEGDWLIIGDQSQTERLKESMASLRPELANILRLMDSRDLSHDLFPDNRKGQKVILIATETAYETLTQLQVVMPTLKPGCRVWVVHISRPESGAPPTSVTAPANGLLMGICRALQQEYPEQYGGYVEHKGAITEISIKGLCRVLAEDNLQREDAWLLTDQGVFVPRLVPVKAADGLSDAGPGVPELDTVLVTGGTGDVGKSVVQWLLEQGARYVVVVSRQEPNSYSIAAFREELASYQDRVVLFQADCCESSQLGEAIAYSRRYGRLSLVIHGAGITDDGLLANQTRERWQSVVDSKYEAACTLVEQLHYDEPLILFSSAVSVLGNIGQANYIAANCALDALARHQHGVLSIGWGAWRDSRMTQSLFQENKAIAPPMESTTALGVFGRIVARFLESFPTETLPPYIMVAPLRAHELASGMGKTRSLFCRLGEDQHAFQTAEQLVNSGEQRHTVLLAQLGQASEEQRQALLLGWLQSKTAELLDSSESNIACDQGLFSLGLDSLKAVALGQMIRDQTGLDIPVTVTINTPHLMGLTQDLLQRLESQWSAIPSSLKKSIAGDVNEKTGKADRKIAIVGAGMNLPGDVYSLDDMREVLQQQKDTVSDIPIDRFDIAPFYNPEPQHPGKSYCSRGSFIQHPARFDPAFFGLSNAEASALDPQQRLLLETSWRALESAGIPSETLRGSRTGVFVGIGPSDYERLKTPDLAELDAHTVIGTHNSFAAGRISHFFALQGPCVAIDTACSSSLVAVHNAVRALRSGECDLALAGGVQLMLSPTGFVALSSTGALAPDGVCKAFSSAADGYGRGEGCAMVVLKRASDLGEDDIVLANIVGSATNHDGASSGLTVPNGIAQESLILQALSDAGLQAIDVGYVETHGTGTQLGDPVEIQALNSVYGAGRTPNSPLWVGSIKGNMGHLESAAGIAGLLRTVATLRETTIPAHIHGEPASPRIPWEDGIVRPLNTPQPWAKTRLRRAGLSAFGLSGTNVHMLLEEAPEPSSEALPQIPDQPLLFVFSAHSASSLQHYCEQCQAFLSGNTRQRLIDIAYSLAVVKDAFRYRLSIIANTSEELTTDLANAAEGLSRLPGSFSGQETIRFSMLSSQQLVLGKTKSEKGALANVYHPWQLAEAFHQGYVIPWKTLYRTWFAQYKPCRVPVPGYQFDWGRYWLKPEKMNQGTGGDTSGNLDSLLPAGRYPLAGYRLKEPGGESGPFTCLVPISRQKTEWIYHHRVYGQAAVAGAVHLGVALDTAADFWQTEALELRQCNFIEPMVPNGNDLIYIRHSPTHDGESLSFVTWSNHPDTGEIIHCRGEVWHRADSRESRQNISREELTQLKQKHLGEITASEWVNRADRLFNLQYDPLWRWVESIQTGDRSVILRLQAPEGTETCSPFLPILFDNVFSIGASLFIDDDIDQDDVTAYTPYEVGRLCYLGDLEWPLTAHYDVTDFDTRETVTGNIRIWDNSGRCIFDIRRYIIKRAPPERLLRQMKGGNDNVEVFHQLQWQEKPIPANCYSTPGFIDVPYKPLILTEIKRESLAQTLALNDALESWAEGFVISKLAEKGVLGQETVEPAARLQSLSILSSQRKLFDRLLACAVKCGYLMGDGSVYRRTDKQLPATTGHSLESLYQRFSDFRPALQLLERCSRGIWEVLTGSQAPLELLYPGGDTTDTTFLYRDIAVAQLNNQLVGARVRDLTMAFASDGSSAPVKILEIGAGSGATTLAVLSALKDMAVEYVFTDISPQFINGFKTSYQAEQTANHHKNDHIIDYRVLDISRPFDDQGFSEGSFDIVIAANVLHATASLKDSLDNIHRLLCHEGQLILVENTSQSLWVDLIFGLLDGWWAFEDYELRPDHPLLSHRNWLSLLEQQGFCQAHTLPLLEDCPGQENHNGKEGQIIIECACYKPQPAATWLITGDNYHDLEQLFVQDNITLQPVTQGFFEAARVKPIDGVLWMRTLEHVGDEDVKEDAPWPAQLKEDCEQLLELKNILTRCEAGASVVLVTSGAIGTCTSLHGVVHAHLWGALRSIEHEYPEFHFVRIDLDPDETHEISANRLVQEVRCLRRYQDLYGKEICWQGSSRRVSAVTPALISPPEAKRDYGIKGDGTYVITGGFGGLGRLFARWLVDHGAQRLILIGRSQPGATTRQCITELEQRGVTVRVRLGDVSDFETMASYIKGESVRGIIHGAGILSDKTLLNLQSEDYLASLKPKLYGALHLHQLTLESTDLDFFIVFSAATSIVGALGQVAHAAANAALDAFAQYRKQAGLPILCINWGRITEAGAAAHIQSATERRMASVGMLPMNPEQAIDKFEQAFRSSQEKGNPCPLIVMPVRRRTVSDNVPAWRGEKGEAIDDQVDILLQVREVADPVNGLITRLEKKILQMLSVYGLDAIDPDASLQSVGVDSVIALEVRNWLNGQLSVSFPASLLYEYPTLRTLSNYLYKSHISRGEAESCPDIEKDPYHALVTLKKKPWTYVV